MPDTNNRKTISDRINALNYDPKTVMVFNGTKIENIEPPADGRFDESTYIVVTREKCSYEADFDIAVPTAHNDVTYPGALILASNDLLDGKPQELGTGRAPLKITVDLPGTDSATFEAVPSYANVKAGINTVLRQWFDKYGNDWSLPANFQYQSSLVYDENELSLRFGCDVAFLKQKLGIDFSRKKVDKKSVYIVHFKQIFYTVSAERPALPGNAFSEATTWDDLVNAGVSNLHPPLFVKNVQYGRQIFLKFESSLSETELETIIKASVSADGIDVKANNSTEYKAKLEKINISLVALGGSEGIYKNFSLKDVNDAQEKINKIIFENGKLSKSNPATPLNYHTVYLKGGISAGIHGKTEYISERTESFRSGAIELKHSGGYVAKFTISWDEISYSNGVQSRKRVSWGKNGENLTAPFATSIPLRGNVRKINIKAEGCTGLAWEWWRASGNAVDLPLVPIRKVHIGGTTLDQTFKMETVN